MAGLVLAVDIGNAFFAALIGASAVVVVSTIVGWVRWLSRLDSRLNVINGRIDAVEELHVGPSAKDLDDRVAIMERNRGPVLDVLNTRLDAFDKRLAAVEKIDVMSMIEALDARLVTLEVPTLTPEYINLMSVVQHMDTRLTALERPPQTGQQSQQPRRRR